MMDLLQTCSFSLHKMITVMFLSAVWTLILTAPIHLQRILWWTSFVMLHFSKFLNFSDKKNKKKQLIYILDDLRLSKCSANFHFWVNYPFITSVWLSKLLKKIHTNCVAPSIFNKDNYFGSKTQNFPYVTFNPPTVEYPFVCAQPSWLQQSGWALWLSPPLSWTARPTAVSVRPWVSAGPVWSKHMRLITETQAQTHSVKAVGAPTHEQDVFKQVDVSGGALDAESRALFLTSWPTSGGTRLAARHKHKFMVRDD